MIVKEHYHDKRLILSVCDSELIGKKFETKDLVLDLSSDFYKGDEKNQAQIALLIKKAFMINFVGKESVSLGIKEGIISEKDAVKIKGIPYAQVLMF